MWKCPKCARTVRLSGTVTSQSCRCSDPPTWMQIVQVPKPELPKFERIVIPEDAPLQEGESPPASGGRGKKKKRDPRQENDTPVEREATETTAPAPIEAAAENVPPVVAAEPTVATDESPESPTASTPDAPAETTEKPAQSVPVTEVAETPEPPAAPLPPAPADQAP